MSGGNVCVSGEEFLFEVVFVVFDGLRGMKWLDLKGVIGGWIEYRLLVGIFVIFVGY